MSTRKGAVDTKNTRELAKARSLKDIIRVVDNIKKDAKKASKVLSNLFKSVSSSNKINISLSGKGKGDATINILDSSIKSVPGTKKAKKGTVKTKPTSYTMPNIKDLVENSDLIERLADGLEELEIARSSAYRDFGDMKRDRETQEKLRKYIDALTDDIAADLEKAYTALRTIASKHVPSQLETYVKSTVKFLQSKLDVNSYESISSFVYAIVDRKVASKKKGDKGNGVVYSYYIKISQLKASDSFVYDEYYVILSCRISHQTGLASYYINSYGDFYRPGDYEYGTLIDSSKKANSVLDTMMTRDDIVSTMFRQSLPLSSKRIKDKGMNSIPGVRGSRVQNNALYVALFDDATQADISRIRKEVISRLRAIFRSSDSSLGKSTFKTKITIGKQSKKTAIQFILAPSKLGNYPGTITQQQVDMLIDGLGFDPKSIGPLRKALLEIGMQEA